MTIDYDYGSDTRGVDFRARGRNGHSHKSSSKKNLPSFQYYPYLCTFKI